MHYFLKQEIDSMHRKGVQVRVIGIVEELPPKVRDIIQYCEEKTRTNSRLILNIAFNYGGRHEIVRAMQQILESNAVQPWNFATIQSRLYTAKLPDVDLLIRTSGEQRISNFLLWQASNAYFYSAEVSWPEFKEPQLLQAIQSYSEYVAATPIMTR
jgi:undecaprenyl diphosphate synthase